MLDTPKNHLKKLSHWLAEQNFSESGMSNRQAKELESLSSSVIQAYQPLINSFDYPDPEILISKPGHRINGMRSGMLLMGENSSTPIHDHANCLGLSLVLQGTITVTFYEPAGSGDDDKNAYLNELESTVVEQFGYSCLPRNSPLLHKVTAINGPACMLDILFTSDQKHLDQSWYLPLSMQSSFPACFRKIAESEFITISRELFPVKQSGSG